MQGLKDLLVSLTGVDVLWVPAKPHHPGPNDRILQRRCDRPEDVGAVCCLGGQGLIVFLVDVLHRVSLHITIILFFKVSHLLAPTGARAPVPLPVSHDAVDVALRLDCLCWVVLGGGSTRWTAGVLCRELDRTEVDI